MDNVELERDGRVLVLRLDRPDALNAFDNALMDDLADALIEARDDDEINVVVLTGAGRAFTAGADLKEMANPTKDEPRHGWPGLLELLLDFPKPLLLAINGVGAGVGATIAGLADIVFIAEGARLRCPFSELGLTAEAASTFTFPRLMGRQRAMWFLWSSEWWSAEQCVEAGLAMELCAPDELMPRVMEHAATLAALPLTSLMTTKELVIGPQREQMRRQAMAENQALGALIGGPANREALAAFRERRAPDFTNLG